MAETSGVPLPLGYTQETLQDYYKSLIQPIEAETAGARGAARTEAFARGLEGTPTETGGVAAADYYGGLRKDTARSGLAMSMAGLAGQQAQQRAGWEWQGSEAEKQREWQSKQNELQRMYGIGMGEAERGQLAEKNRYGYQGAIAELGMSWLGSGLAAASGGGGGGGGMGAGV